MAAMSRRSTDRPLWLIPLLALAALALQARAQDPEPPRLTVTSLLVDQQVVLARKMLEGQGEVREDQFSRASILLRQATRLAPQDEQIWRMVLELADMSKNAPMTLEALDQVVRLDPRDDRAMLRMIQHRVGNEQTLEARIALIDRLLSGEQAASFSPALRSRLLSATAIFARENNDWTRFRATLPKALALDPTNVEAASLLYDLAVQRKGSVLQQGLALLAIVRADPMLLDARRQLADLLLSRRAFHAASKGYEVTTRLRQGVHEDQGFFFAWVVALIGDGRQDDALDLINQVDAYYQQMTRMAAGSPVPEGQPDRRPAMKLIPPLQLVRLLLLQATDQPTGASAALDRIISELAGDPKAAEALAWTYLLADAHLDQVETILIKGLIPDDSPNFTLIQGMLKCREGNQDAARDLLEPLAQEHAPAALAMAWMTPDDDPQRHDLLARVFDLSPASPFAVAALLDANRRKQPLPILPDGKNLADRIDQWPTLIATPDIEDPLNRRLALKITVSPTTYSYLEPITATFELRNLSRLAFSMAPNGTLPSMLLLQASPRQGGDSMGLLQDQVVNMSRRLRLEPDQSISVKVRLDRARLGDLLATSPFSSISFTLIGLLDPRATPDGRFFTGPLGARDSTELIQRTALAPDEASIEGWINAVHDPDPVEQVRAMARLVQLGDTLVSPDLPDALKNLPARIADALADRFLRLPPIAQALLVRFMPQTPASTDMLQKVHALAQRSDDPLVAVIYLATQVTDPDSPVIDAGLRHPDPDVQEFAQATRVALRAAAQAAPGNHAPGTPGMPAGPGASPLSAPVQSQPATPAGSTTEPADDLVK
ncbi:MAG: hypothetical protein IT441_08520 [Phycisphaeraceae bacterium]|nr:hypothetical protein [Phycisphaeraceae bacterium]